jgi:biotin operon repressor
VPTGKIEAAKQRLVLCRLMFNVMRTLHESYIPADEAFGKHLEIVYIGLSLAIGQIEGKPFSVAKVAAYMNVPRTTVVRRLDTLKKWGLIERQGRHYFIRPEKVNSLIGMRSYKQNRRFVHEADKEMSALDALPIESDELVY